MINGIAEADLSASSIPREYMIHNSRGLYPNEELSRPLRNGFSGCKSGNMHQRGEFSFNF